MNKKIGMADLGKCEQDKPIWKDFGVEQPRQCKRCTEAPYRCSDCSVPVAGINLGIGYNALREDDYEQETNTKA